MATPIGLQLYSVREYLGKDFPGTIERIARMDYSGIETAGFPESITPIQARTIFDQNG